MVTIFIFYFDLKSLTPFLNDIFQSNNIKLIGFDETLSKSSIEFCNKNFPHIIIADKQTHKKLYKLLDFNYIAITIPQNLQFSTVKISNQINKFIYDSKYSHKLELLNFRKHIYSELQKSKFNTNLCGTQYLLDCIVYVHENPYHNLNNSNIKKFFNPIAQKYNTNVNSINWNIHTAIEDMCKSTSNEFRKNVYGTNFAITPQTIIRVFSNLY